MHRIEGTSYHCMLKKSIEKTEQTKTFLPTGIDCVKNTY